MDPTSAQTLSFYSLIATGDTANTADNVVFDPIGAVYDSGAKMVTLTFSARPGHFGCQSGRQQLPPADRGPVPGDRNGKGGQNGDIVTTDRSNDAIDNSLVDIGSTFSAAADLGDFSTYSPVPADPLSPSTAQSWVLSGQIGAIPYDLEWPGGQDTPGERSLPTGATDVAGENHTPLDSGDTGPTGLIPTYYYNFQSDYGTINGTAQLNQITATEEQRVREIYSLYSAYFGVQFVETADQGVTVAVGDIRAINPTAPTGAGSPAGMATGGPTNGEAILNSYYDWGTGAFGGLFMYTMMHEIMHTLGYGHSFDLPPDEIMGSSLPGVDETGGETTTQSGGDAAFPDNGDIVSGQYMYRPDSMDIDLYQFQVDQAGNFSAETVAQRLQDASLLNTALVLYNSQGQVVARNDDYYGTDSFINVPLTPGTYYIGVSASGNDQYDPDIANSGVGGTSEGPYDLRLTFQPQVSTQLVNAQGIALDGDADGTAGGEYNFWFNTNTASTTASQNNTLIVDKAAPTTAVTAWVKTSATRQRAICRREAGWFQGSSTFPGAAATATASPARLWATC